MQPEMVRPSNFRVRRIIYNDIEEQFAIAWGEWTRDGTMHLAMRWNGGNDNDPGYPTSHHAGKPLWFLLPSNLTTPIIKGVLDVKLADELLP